MRDTYVCLDAEFSELLLKHVFCGPSLYSDLFVPACELESLGPPLFTTLFITQSSQYWQLRKKDFLKRCEKRPEKGDMQPRVIAATQNEQNTGQEAIRSWHPDKSCDVLHGTCFRAHGMYEAGSTWGHQSHLCRGFVNYVTLMSCLWKLQQRWLGWAELYFLVCNFIEESSISLIMCPMWPRKLCGKSRSDADGEQYF